MGEPAGIGGDITLKAWRRRAEGLDPFFVIDDPERLAALARRIGVAVPVAAIADPAEAPAAFAEALPVLPEPLAAPVEPGRLDPANAPAVIKAIDRAVALVGNGQAAAMVTNPIHKKCLLDVGFRHRGHTDYLAERARAPRPPVMMLSCPDLRVVPVTVHLALAEAVAALDTDHIVYCAEVTATALTRDFGIAEPRMAVAALNPHGGENGVMGREEIEIIAPAVRYLKSRGIGATGPLPADTLFHERARKLYDVTLCMYHDQALIPIKTIDFDRGVNVTLGLPFVRTSPDHGTALEIAGTGAAREDSMMAALRLAGDMARRRGLNG